MWYHSAKTKGVLRHKLFTLHSFSIVCSCAALCHFISLPHIPYTNFLNKYSRCGGQDMHYKEGESNIVVSHFYMNSC